MRPQTSLSTNFQLKVATRAHPVQIGLTWMLQRCHPLMYVPQQHPSYAAVHIQTLKTSTKCKLESSLNTLLGASFSEQPYTLHSLPLALLACSARRLLHLSIKLWQPESLLFTSIAAPMAQPVTSRSLQSTASCPGGPIAPGSAGSALLHTAARHCVHGNLCRCPPLACMCPPLACRCPPLACMCPPLACMCPPLACMCPPLACTCPPLVCMHVHADQQALKALMSATGALRQEQQRKHEGCYSSSRTAAHKERNFEQAVEKGTATTEAKGQTSTANKINRR